MQVQYDRSIFFFICNSDEIVCTVFRFYQRGHSSILHRTRADRGRVRSRHVTNVAIFFVYAVRLLVCTYTQYTGTAGARTAGGGGGNDERPARAQRRNSWAQRHRAAAVRLYPLNSCWRARPSASRGLSATADEEGKVSRRRLEVPAIARTHSRAFPPPVFY